MLFTVIIPVYNAAKYIKEAANSVLLHKEVSELILVDDGSQDGSYEICLELLGEDERIKLFHHVNRKNKGPAASRNLGIKKAQNKWLAFLDSDDLYEKDRFLETISIIKNDLSVDFIHGRARFFGAELKDVDHLYSSDEIYFNSDQHGYEAFEDYFLGTKGWTSLCTCTIKKEVFEQIGYFDENLYQAEDTDFILRALLHCNTRKLSDRIIAKARQHPDRSILNKEKYHHYRASFYQKWYEILMVSNWSSKMNRYFINSYMYYTNSNIRETSSSILRKSKKVMMLVHLIVKDPIIVKKLLFGK
ncbi:glycosyltransferase family 2 protein [Portibacter marinus]|uniref:glycosyltransferase family 2 protein n=1 Tax=Portibacter marinus TaxID=2898660 RepID=UPI001F197C22|nr:glycosyltransferase [Portibacter marinus]